ncbi:MAG: 50S ribosomal protein L3 [Bradymonadaceae bacterium]|nr:50S ribosomal protein L3 [Lujinxingiaceae bacterium]
MSKGILARKVGMTQIFDELGNRISVTVVDVSGNVVIEKKSVHGKAGYSAVKLGFGDVHKHEKEGTEPIWRLAKPRVGVFLKAGIEAPRRHVIEIRLPESDLDQYEVGKELTAEFFSAGEWVDVVGTSKGSGFSGVMKRHNFRGAKASHGAHEVYRHGGSIGTSATPSRVMPGKKMAGQHGNARVTIQNLRIFRVLADDNALIIRGAIPGPNGGVVTIKTAVKKTVA